MPWNGLRPPYPGLAPLEEEDAAVYFGREPEIRRIVERLTARRSLGGSALLVVLGASGAGKSSLLRAGVVPRLRRTGRQWIAPPPFRPQSKPVDSFALSLASALGNSGGWRALSDRLRDALQYGTQHTLLADLANGLRQASNANDASILIAIDQGEELFQHSAPEERHLFFHLLSAALGEDLPYIGLRVIRSDGLAALQGEDRLAVALEQLSLAPLPLERLEEVIRGSARVAGLRVEAALTRNILRDATSGEALPLLAFTLRELRDRSAPVHHLTARACEALGDPRLGLSPLDNAVRAAADRALAMLRPDDAQLAALRDAFVPHMVRVTESGDYGRRPANWQAVHATAHPMLEALIAARVLTLREERGERIVEVAHEALLRKWPLLRRWLDEDRQCLLDLQHWQLAEREWSEAKPEDKDGLLLSGLKLTRARSWLQERPRDIPATVRAFVEASMAKADSQQLRALARRRAVITALSALTGLVQTRQVWDHGRPQGKPIPTAQVGLRSLLVLRDGDLLSCGYDGRLERWRGLRHLKPILVNGGAPVLSLAELPNGDVLAGDANGLLRRLRWPTWQGPGSATGHSAILSILPLSNRDWLTAGRDGTLRRWRDGQPIGPVLTVVEANWSWRIAMLPSRDLVVSTDGKGFLRKLVPPAVVIQEACGKPVQGAPLRQPPMPESQHPHSSFMERRQMLV